MSVTLHTYIPAKVHQIARTEVMVTLGLRTCRFFRGRRQGRQPLNPGAGPAPVSSPEAFGGNRRLYTLAAPAGDLPRTYLRSIPVHPRPTIIVVIYSVFCVWCSKNIVFYRVSGPSAAQNCTLAMLKNVGFSTVFALRGGKNRKKLSLTMFST